MSPLARPGAGARMAGALRLAACLLLVLAAQLALPAQAQDQAQAQDDQAAVLFPEAEEASAPPQSASQTELTQEALKFASSTDVLADRAKGRVVAHLQPLATDRSIDLELGAAAEALALQTSLADRLEEGDEVEELAFTTRDHCEVLRPVAKHPDLFLYGLFERSQFNVAMASLAMRSLETGLEELEPKGPGEA